MSNPNSKAWQFLQLLCVTVLIVAWLASLGSRHAEPLTKEPNREVQQNNGFGTPERLNEPTITLRKQ